MIECHHRRAYQARNTCIFTANYNAFSMEAHVRSDDSAIESIDGLNKIIRRNAVWPNEREDILIACKTLNVDPYDPKVTHWLANLSRELHLSDEMRLLDVYQFNFLKSAVMILELECPAIPQRTCDEWVQRFWTWEYRYVPPSK